LAADIRIPLGSVLRRASGDSKPWASRPHIPISSALVLLLATARIVLGSALIPRGHRLVLAWNLASISLLSGLSVALGSVPGLRRRRLGITLLGIAIACHRLLLGRLRIRLAVITRLGLLLGLGITLGIAATWDLTAVIRHVGWRISLRAPIPAVLCGRRALVVSLCGGLGPLIGLLCAKLLLRRPGVIRVELINRITCPPGPDVTDSGILYRVPAGAP